MSDNSRFEDVSMPVLILFITGTAPRSKRAKVNLYHMLDHIGLTDIRPHEIDLLETPTEGIKHSVFATPALMRVGHDGKVSVLYGDLSEEDRLRGFLYDLVNK